VARQLRKCVYAGSFDPLTEGHMYMIREGARLFDILVVALGVNPAKHCTFSVADRLAVIRESVGDIPNVEVDEFGAAYLVQYAASVGAGYILRGLRSQQDYEFESTMRHVNADINGEITTVFLMPPREFREISSSFVKGLVGPEGWKDVVRPYVPPAVYRLLLRSDIIWPWQSGGPDSPAD
jgi:pantetheine-phosphate adenylyltransferase/8-oxo-dGTP diphosphatase